MQRRTFVMAVASAISMTRLASAGNDHQVAKHLSLEGMGYPELDVTVSVAGYEGIPESLAAGRYLVNITAGDDIEDMAGVAFMQPAGMSAGAFLEIVLGPPPEGDSEAMGLPADLFEATFVGGTYTTVGVTAQMVIDFGPGEWIAWADDPTGTQQPVIFEATGEMPTDLAEPESIATLTMSEYRIDLTAGVLKAGAQVIKVENIGAQPHFLSANTVPAGTTVAEVEAVLNAEMTGSPVPESGLNPEEDLGPGFYTATQSTGTAVWALLDLKPGTYALLCHFPDVADGMPHAFHGMYNVVEVAE